MEHVNMGKLVISDLKQGLLGDCICLCPCCVAIAKYYTQDDFPENV